MFRGILVLLFLLPGLLTGCEDPGNVGGDFLDPDVDLEAITYSVTSMEQQLESGFTGNQQFMALGRYEDPYFGDVSAIGILKPSIDTTRIGSSLSGEDPFQLRLVFSSDMVGDTTSVAEFELYRVDEVWRGNELRVGDELMIEESQMVGEFSVSGREAVTIDLDPAWVEEFNEYLSYQEEEEDDEDRNSRYRNEFPGLAIVPTGGTAKVLFAAMEPADPQDEEEDLEFVRFVLESESEEDSGGEDSDDEDDEDDDRIFQPLDEWGSLVTRESSELPEEINPLHSTLDGVTVLEPNLNVEEIGRNVVNATLILHVDRAGIESLPGGHARPEVEHLRIHLIDSENISERLNQTPDFATPLDEEEGTYRFNITDYVNSLLFSSPASDRFHISVQVNQRAERPGSGILYSTAVFNQNAPEELRPEIVITSVNPENE